MIQYFLAFQSDLLKCRMLRHCDVTCDTTHPRKSLGGKGWERLGKQYILKFVEENKDRPGVCPVNISLSSSLPGDVSSNDAL